MELKKFAEKVKTVKYKNTVLSLTLNVLKLEEVFEEKEFTEKIINYLGEILKDSFALVNENKIPINNKEMPDFDLDNWKDSVKLYKKKMPAIPNARTYLYVMRSSLKNILDEKDIKIYLFDLIIKTFLFIDTLNLSIDSVLEMKANEIVVVKEPVKKEEVKKEIVETKQHD